VGESKRRRQSDPNYGKTEPLKPELINYCNSAIAQETAFIILDFWTDAGGIAIAPIDIDKLATNQRAAYQIATQPTFLDLGIRRQHEQSLGSIGIMDRHFRALIGINDFNSKEYFIFNWFSSSEIERSYRRCNHEGKGKAAVFEIMKQLIATCDPNYQFPCWFSGIPGKEPNTYSDLIFICDQRHPSDIKIDTHVSRENYL
jgi:hypothetical protein